MVNLSNECISNLFFKATESKSKSKNSKPLRENLKVKSIKASLSNYFYNLK